MKLTLIAVKDPRIEEALAFEKAARKHWLLGGG